MYRKLVIVLIFMVFATPVALSILLHSQWLDWRAPASVNHGELIDPVTPLGVFRLPDSSGQMLDEGALGGHWQLVLVDTRGCGAECLERLYWLRQVRRAQDRHQPDIGLVMITPQALEAAVTDQIAELATDIRVFDGDSGSQLAARFPRPDPAASYIMDPAGNIIIRFDAGADPNGIRRDLRRLLTWTQRD